MAAKLSLTFIVNADLSNSLVALNYRDVDVGGCGKIASLPTGGRKKEADWLYYLGLPDSLKTGKVTLL